LLLIDCGIPFERASLSSSFEVSGTTKALKGASTRKKRKKNEERERRMQKE
jgi:hypothetical protein